MIFFGSINTLWKRQRKWNTHFCGLYYIFCIWTESLLNKNMPQLKMTSHVDPGAGACWAAVGQQCNLPKKSFEIQMCCCITIPCATNECLIIWGESCTAETGAGWIPAVHCQGSKCRRHAHTHARTQWREKENQNDLKISFFVCGHFKEEQLRNSTKCRALEGNDKPISVRH